MRKAVNTEIKETEEELNQMENLKVKALTKPDISQEEKNLRVDTVEKAATSLKSKLTQLWKKFSDTMAFLSRAKWFEYGEKSNKFFLNLIRSRQNQKYLNFTEIFTCHNQQSRKMRTTSMKSI